MRALVDEAVRDLISFSDQPSPPRQFISKQNNLIVTVSSGQILAISHANGLLLIAACAGYNAWTGFFLVLLRWHAVYCTTTIAE